MGLSRHGGPGYSLQMYSNPYYGHETGPVVVRSPHMEGIAGMASQEGLKPGQLIGMRTQAPSKRTHR